MNVSMKNSFNSYGMYDENGEAMAGGGGETVNGGTIPMEEFTPAPKPEEFANFENQDSNGKESGSAPEPTPKTANPFKKDTNITTNPFNQ